MTADELFAITSLALAEIGAPEWDSPDVPGQRDTLVYLSAEAEDDGPLWALTPVGSDEADFVPLDTQMAQALLRAHVRQWLLERGWQVQVAVRKQKQHWRLAECLSLAAGGGDRLDAEYPYGEDELGVMCASVRVLLSS